MKNLYKIFIGGFVACLLLVVADWAVGSWSEKMYHKSKYGIYHRQLYCLEQSNDEILIMGSSRAAHHYVPQIFEDSLGMSCYNAGSDGQCIYYHYTLLASMLERGARPKAIIYEVMDLDAVVSKSETFTLDAAIERLTPHYGEFSVINDLFKHKDWKEKIKLMSHTFKYNSKLVQTIKCNYLPEKEDKGYEALNGTIKLVKKKEIKDVDANMPNTEIENLKLIYISKLIELCRNNHIFLIFAISPTFSGKINFGAITIESLALKNNIPFVRFNDTEKFKDHTYFYDRLHLNDKGARLFSQMFSHYLKSKYYIN